MSFIWVAFTSAVWRSLPYYGRLIFSLNYVCFYSKVLAGRQKVNNRAWTMTIESTKEWPITD
ncbi:hypothetical protein BX666DRAFT_1930812 [Dichotomocladium elegans]|nr:hypothetical protein BX666DRAFT_1930812 [Dichotomocladium elegans]